jgi:hypothetical protein
MIAHELGRTLAADSNEKGHVAIRGQLGGQAAILRRGAEHPVSLRIDI